ncbi:MAG: glycosyltransferase family 2 protein [Christensenellaceae bacterium]|nr:glycosyltransferase family 2 protein [Christensenellaceae bacterium]
MKEKLYLVIPCYNEEEVLGETCRRLKEKMQTLLETGRIHEDSRVVLVDDGSKDATWQLISRFHSEDPLFSGIKLSRNRGHQNALLAGLMTVREQADVVISMDADLQDDINAIDAMLDKYEEGCHIVYGVRSARHTDTAFKKNTARGFYKLLSKMGVDVVYDHADYRLMSRRALAELADFKEVNLFLRGMIPQIGLKSATVPYARGERFAGESKYPLKKMLNFAGDGITSMSIRPIRLILSFGCLTSALSGLSTLALLVLWLCGVTPGWLAAASFLWLMLSLQLVAIGVVGEYVGKNYMETKARPRYIVEEYLAD